MDQHYLDRDGVSTAKGNYSENEYEKKLIKRKIKYRAANRFEQRLHFDFKIGDAKVEVKSAKSKNKYEEPAYDEIVLELHGMQPYNTGWLQGGEADFVAFHQKDGSFLHFRREQLLAWINEELIKHNGSEAVEKNWGVEVKDYQLYYRPGNRLERFCYVPLKDIPLKSIKLS